jgi:hypothetical protein
MSQSVTIIQSNAAAAVIIALEGETQSEYDKRNLKKGTINKCSHNYDGQDNLRRKRCNFCKCVLYITIKTNQKYSIYGDDYL